MRMLIGLCCFSGLIWAQNPLMEARSNICDKNYGAAKSVLEGYLATDPGNQEAQLLLVSTLCYMKQQSTAKQFAAQKAGTSTLLEAQVALFERKVPEAKKLLEARLGKEDDYLARYLLGYALVLERKSDDALVQLKRAYALNNRHAETLFLLGDLYRAKDQVTEVATYWTAYLEVVPGNNGCTSYVRDYLKRAGGQ
ncbi:MAG: hypothetical protein KDC35_20375 [Acidobacteria bacterium]|nr:hypothetical protein [Acidobacteriota bacterium]